MPSADPRFRSSHRTMPRLWMLVILFCIGLTLTGCGGITGSSALPTPTPLPALPAVEKPRYTVTRGDIVEELRLSGRVAATQQDDLHFLEGGIVVEVYVRATEVGAKGRLLAELDQDKRLSQLEQAQLALDQAKLALKRGQDQQRFAVQLAELDLEEAETRLNLPSVCADRRRADRRTG